MEYSDKVLEYLLTTIKSGESIPVNKLSKDPEKFVNTVKALMDERSLQLNEWEFSNDFLTLKRMRP